MSTSRPVSSTILALAAAAALALAAPAFAVPDVKVKVSNIGDASDKSTPGKSEERFLNSLEAGYASEDFEGFEGGSRHQSLDTAAGTFTQQVAGKGGLCRNLPGGCNGGVSILDVPDSPYDDRYAISGDKWLDNAGTRLLRFTPIGGINSIGFFATDLGDPNKQIDVKISVDGEMVDISHLLFGVEAPNAGLRYITFRSKKDIDELWIQTNENKEGYGIDDITVGRKIKGMCTPR
jgi:hypothetical protein